jgi:hypothetical protein
MLSADLLFLLPRVKPKKIFMQNGTQLSQTCSKLPITPNPTQNRRGRCLFAFGEYKLDLVAFVLNGHAK